MPVNARDLFEAIGMVDEDLVEEADGPVRRPAWTPRRGMGRVLPVAACLCIVGAAVLSFGRGMFSAKSSGGARSKTFQILSRLRTPHPPTMESMPKNS